MTTTSNNQRGSHKGPASVVDTAARRMTPPRTRKTSIDRKARSETTPEKAATGKGAVSCASDSPSGTAISCCVQDELLRYFDMLDGEKPSGLYRMVIRQAEQALLSTVMRECGGNQSRAAEWLGISRGNLRNKLAEMD